MHPPCWRPFRDLARRVLREVLASSWSTTTASSRWSSSMAGLMNRDNDGARVDALEGG